MAYVPVVVPPQPPSPRTRELAQLLGRVIEEYEKHHPAVTGPEVRGALRMAARSSKAAAVPAAALAAGLGLVLLLAGVAAFLLVQGGSPSGGTPGLNGLVIVLASVIAVAFLIKRLAGK
ncbi:MAG TPA: hypothetical protein VJ997_08405 [Longimicrobiales bacterium]|nr:hypothetical protein [Longimicrobiales bacterium]